MKTLGRLKFNQSIISRVSFNFGATKTFNNLHHIIWEFEKSLDFKKDTKMYFPLLVIPNKISELFSAHLPEGFSEMQIEHMSVPCRVITTFGIRLIFDSGLQSDPRAWFKIASFTELIQSLISKKCPWLINMTQLILYFRSHDFRLLFENILSYQIREME